MYYIIGLLEKLIVNVMKNKLEVIEYLGLTSPDKILKMDVKTGFFFPSSLSSATSFPSITTAPDRSIVAAL